MTVPRGEERRERERGEDKREGGEGAEGRG
jgi:hypothetical protein